LTVLDIFPAGLTAPFSHHHYYRSQIKILAGPQISGEFNAEEFVDFIDFACFAAVWQDR
jgi:hypothetical protein